MEGICNIVQGSVKGYIKLKDTKLGLKISIDLTNIKEGYHGFHIHNYGDLREGCKSLGSHYNPDNKTHGGLHSKIKHKGDLGNIYASKNNSVKTYFYVNDLKVKELLGRSIVIHEKKDDLGKGNNKESLITGNAGKRIGCGIIGYYNSNYK